MSTGFRDRLRRLRREGDVDTPPSATPSRADSVRGRLRRRAALDLARQDADDDAAELAVASTQPTTTGLPEGLHEDEHDGERVLARCTRVPSRAPHGTVALGDVATVEPEVFSFLTRDTALADVDLTRAVYLDTETTGLAGGVGTWVFLVGLGRFRPAPGDASRDASHDDGDGGSAQFEVWQGFLSDPDDERALMAETARRIRESEAVVSFFGKSFDRHRLEDKMRVCGVAPPFDEVPHLDLYHPLTRLYGGGYADGRLQTMERELCGVEREDDLPGALAPAAWFDFLADRPHRLEGVFRHHLDDVLSLASLAAHVGRVRSETRADGRPLEGRADLRAAALARRCAELGRRDEAAEWIDRAIERAVVRGGDPRHVRSLRLVRADNLRLARRDELAIEAYEALVAEGEDVHTTRCHLELAKLCEHRRRDVAAALAHCERAAEALTRGHVGTDQGRLEADLGTRRARLTRKQGARDTSASS